MKLIGIIGAMEVEVASLKEMMTDVTIRTKASMEFNHGYLNGKEVVVVRSGIGKVNAGICTQILVDDYGVDCVINTGIAGSLRNEINIGDIVISTDAVQHDMDVRIPARRDSADGRFKLPGRRAPCGGGRGSLQGSQSGNPGIPRTRGQR